MGDNILKLIRPADVITLVNAVLGFASIIMSLKGEFDNALVLILIAVIADGADGAVARYSGNGVLGANLDSLADVISFGVAPAVAAFIYMERFSGIMIIFPVLFLACGMLRLARFNITEKKDSFDGIPITSAGFVVALYLLAESYFPYIELFVLLLIILSYLMVSTIRYPKLKSPRILATMGLLLVIDIAAFYGGMIDLVRTISLLLLAFLFAYILIPATGRFYVRDQ